MRRSIQFFKQLLTQFARALLVLTLMVSGSAVLFVMQTDQQVNQQAQDGWGSEVVYGDHHGMSRFSPIPLANACGLGASSCFKCHNGKRAVAANMDAEKAPWHSHHAKVNNSCVGCHQGNPRLMKKAMAHTRMLSNPLSDLNKACSTCHSGDDVNGLSKPYMSLRGE